MRSASSLHPVLATASVLVMTKRMQRGCGDARRMQECGGGVGVLALPGALTHIGTMGTSSSRSPHLTTSRLLTSIPFFWCASILRHVSPCVGADSSSIFSTRRGSSNTQKGGPVAGTYPGVFPPIKNCEGALVRPSASHPGVQGPAFRFEVR